MKTINRFDALALLILLAALFTVGIHIASRGTDEPIEHTVNIMIAASGDGVAAGCEALIDGKLSATVTAAEAEYITLTCRGKLCEAGVLIGGTKYLALNQPIKAKCTEKFVEGRIIRLVIE